MSDDVERARQGIMFSIKGLNKLYAVALLESIKFCILSNEWEEMKQADNEARSSP